MRAANGINELWVDLVRQTLGLGIKSAPRGKEIKELIGAQYNFSMDDPIITIKERKANYAFALGEAWWITAGRNRVDEITPFMKRYSDFSDDGIYLRGAYGPQFIDQIPYVIETLKNDPDSRQACLSLWRNRPGPSKDIPCTAFAQYFIRDGFLHSVVTMRSQDLYWGFTYDTFTFTAMAKMIATAYHEAGGPQLPLGRMTVNVGSLHIYEPFYTDASAQAEAFKKKGECAGFINPLRMSYDTTRGLIDTLRTEALMSLPKAK